MYPDILALFHEYEKAVDAYTDRLKNGRLTKEARLNMLYNRAQCLARLQRYAELCADLAYLKASGFKRIDETLFTYCP